MHFQPIVFLRSVQVSNGSPSLFLAGTSDPFVKLRLGPARQTTGWKKATLNPVWKERFKMPIVAWTPGDDCTLELKVGRMSCCSCEGAQFCLSSCTGDYRWHQHCPTGVLPSSVGTCVMGGFHMDYTGV